MSKCQEWRQRGPLRSPSELDVEMGWSNPLWSCLESDWSKLCRLEGEHMTCGFDPSSTSNPVKVWSWETLQEMRYR